ncbi:MAG: stage II sporulation protein M [Acidobacteriota bacterium]
MRVSSRKRNTTESCILLPVLKNFLESRLGKWKRLEELTARASRLRLKSLSGEEVREFGQLYRRTAADLAIAREEVRDQRLVNYLNHLVARAHGAIYRNESSGFGVFLSFFRYEFPAVFRKTFPYTLTAFLTFILAGALAAAACLIDEGFADRIAPQLRQSIAEHHNWTESVNRANPLASTSIQTNNINVTFYAFAGGVLGGIGTLWVLAQNGLLLGMVISLCIRYRFWEIPTFIAAHGVIELTAIFISGGAGLLIGKALLMPGDLRRIDALVTNGRLAIKLILGCIPMLLIAGLIEGFISPAHIPPAYKFSISAMSALVMAMYFLKPDSRSHDNAG